MTVAIGIEAIIAAAIAPHVPDGAQCEPVNPAEEIKAKAGSVWVEEVDVNSQWRGLGATGAASHARRAESGSVKLMIVCYREAPRYPDAAAAARARRDELIAAVEAAVQADVTLGLGPACWARVDRVHTLLWPRSSGASAGAQIYLALEARP